MRSKFSIQVFCMEISPVYFLFPVPSFLGDPQAGFGFFPQNLSACNKIVQGSIYHSPVGPSASNFTSVWDLNASGLHSLVYVPRHSVEASLRGYVSAFVFSLLSGRRLFHLQDGVSLAPLELSAL